MKGGERRKVAQMKGFEPSEYYIFGGLANRCTKPLCDICVYKFLSNL